jgi:hypothetical protein
MADCSVSIAGKDMDIKGPNWEKFCAKENIIVLVIS